MFPVISRYVQITLNDGIPYIIDVEVCGVNLGKTMLPDGIAIIIYSDNPPTLLIISGA
ncbi:MAG: hypothetical protein J6W50_05205 [Bacteroidaceae bacterium]|nr:hypothetical protein [Bacteroidaceae bacterium]